MTITLRMAWRNLWRHKRRTWLTVGAMIFSNLILVFSISLQLGSYRMMIDNSLKSYTGHMQIQRKGYNEEPKIRSSIDALIPLDLHLTTTATELPHTTWQQRQPNTPWDVEGGDFVSTALATTSGNPGFARRGSGYRFSSSLALRKAVQDTAGPVGRLTLLVKLQHEAGSRQIFRLASHSDQDAALRPRLEIRYTIPIQTEGVVQNREVAPM